MTGNIKHLNLFNTGIKELPQSVWSHEKISYLNISHCVNLEKLPSNRCKLKVFGSFNLDGCTSLGEFSELPRDISKLSLVGCKRLVSLPTSVCKLKYLEELNLSSCFKFEDFPKILEPMEHLKSLNLSGTMIQELHSSIDISRCSISLCAPNLENFPEILEPMEDLKFLDLRGTTETPIVEAIELSTYESEKQPLNFKLMSNLIMLIGHTFGLLDNKSAASLDLPNSLRYLYWLGYSLESLPSKFSPENLVELHMPWSRVKKLWQEDQRLVNLQVIDLFHSMYLTEVPNLSGSLKILTHLDLQGCRSLKYLPEMPRNIEYLDLSESGIKQLPQSVWSHEKISYLGISSCRYLEKLPSNRCKLKVSGSFYINSCTSLGEFSELPRDINELSLVSCTRLVSLPTNICKLKYLEGLNLSRCFKLENFPKILEPMEHLKSLNLSGTAVQELHSLIEFLPALKRLILKRCKRLSSIPKSICTLKYLEVLNLFGCCKFEDFPEILEPMEHLKYLNLRETAVQELHSLLEFLPALKILNLERCKRLSSIPKSICKLKYLEELNLSWCSKLENFPEILEPMEHLKSLNLSGTAVQVLHSSVEFLPALKILKLRFCRSLSSVPKSICKLKYLEELDLSWCSKLENFPEILEPMEDLRCLKLCGTVVQELHLSGKFLPALQWNSLFSEAMEDFMEDFWRRTVTMDSVHACTISSKCHIQRRHVLFQDNVA
ncbi:protein suppressor of npr1-1 [Pyrus ussuriensis x Pyrus communis]|uniref:Protein suppressor of npr1-1 n=1 Tax=Pyrus ussuriensis x Pyrus communis TaxID=2448454 RepID=A0A5N5H4W1_9ROSA|nr:protein suppressor of npr1-1 [Pyrus ussuriensis x Pyrus communis]